MVKNEIMLYRVSGLNGFDIMYLAREYMAKEIYTVKYYGVI